MKHVPKLIKIKLLTVVFFSLVLSVELAHAAIDDERHDKLVGSMRMTYLYWDVFDARLYSQTGKFRKDRPFTLKLTYLRNFKGNTIAKSSAREMQKQGLNNEKRIEWLQFMTSIFPDVIKGASLVGVVDKKRHTTFFYQDQKIGEIRDPEFAKWFFNIWLGENTSNPKLRRQLLGE